MGKKKDKNEKKTEVKRSCRSKKKCFSFSVETLKINIFGFIQKNGLQYQGIIILWRI
jgi:hypothetical protein